MTKKLSDEQFFTILRENGGLFHYTAKAIEKEFKVSYSRQAVHDRASRHPEILQDIKEESLDKAERGLGTLMEGEDDRIKMQALQLYLKTIGKTRGYVEKTEVDNTHSFPDKIELKFTKPKEK